MKQNSVLRVYLCGLHSPEKFQTSIYRDLIFVLEAEKFCITSDILDAQIIIMCDYSKAEWKSLNRHKNKYKVLLRLEARSILPIQYQKRVEREFDLVFDLGRISKGPKEKVFELPYPYSYSENPIGDRFHEVDLTKEGKFYRDSLSSFECWSSRPHQIVMIASNKESHNVWNNYRCRRVVLKRNNKIVLYGTLWNQPLSVILKNRFWIMQQGFSHLTFTNFLYFFGGLLHKFQNYRGVVNNKSDILLNAKFNLVIENGNDALTEKVFDSLVCGAIPLYFGPNLKKLNFPQNLVFQAESKKDLLQLVENPPEISESWFQTWAESRANFINKLIEDQGTFNPKSVFFKLVRVLEEKASIVFDDMIH